MEDLNLKKILMESETLKFENFETEIILYSRREEEGNIVIEASTHNSLMELVGVISPEDLIIKEHDNQRDVKYLEISTETKPLGIAVPYEHWDWNRISDDLDWRFIESFNSEGKSVETYVIKIIPAPDTWGYASTDTPEVFKGVKLGFKFVIPKEPKYDKLVEYLDVFFKNRICRTETEF